MTTTKKKTTLQPLPDLHAKPPFREKLKTLFSCRMRLSEDERQILKAAYRELRDKHRPVTKSLPGSTVRTETQYDLEAELGFGSIVLSDLLGSRETLPITTILRIQNVLGVEIVKKEYLMAAAESYIDYILDTYNDPE